MQFRILHLQLLDCAVGYLHAANAYVKGFIQKDMEISADATRLTVFLVRYQDGSNTPVTQRMAYDLSGI